MRRQIRRGPDGRRRLTALATALALIWHAHSAAAVGLQEETGLRIHPNRTRRHRRGNEDVLTLSGARQSQAVNADLADLLAVLEQRRRLHPRPRLLPFIVNPFSPLLLCDHHYGTELEPDPDVVINRISVDNAHLIKPCEAVCVNAKGFDEFATAVLPLIRTQIILFTSRFHIPQVEQSPLTDAVKAHPNISHWFAQNPVYPVDDRYTAFPYGIRADLLEHYAPAFLAYHTAARGHAVEFKNKTIEHLPFTMTHPSRKPFLTDHVRNVPVMTPPQFYERIARAHFLISPRGDRQDTYRHWEAIGLGAIPIANVNKTLYGSLFREDMVYMEDAGEIISLLDDQAQASLKQQYHVPGAHRVSSLFWARQVGKARDACLRRLG